MKLNEYHTHLENAKQNHIAHKQKVKRSNRRKNKVAKQSRKRNRK